jgi:hypothetical protein
MKRFLRQYTQKPTWICGSIELSMILQAFSISPEEIVSGGEIRKQLEANKNQSVSTPPEPAEGLIH